MKIAIIKYNAGNIRSVLFALERIGIEAIVTDDREEIRSADKVIFPGVGEAGSAMKYLRERKLDELILQLKQPVLGICLGLQLMCKHSEEANTDCLGIFPLKVKKFTGPNKVPQIGWNNISRLGTNLFHNIPGHSYVYFVHSYYAEQGHDTIAETWYDVNFSAALQKDNFYAVQFHPEKSGAVGEQILKNFIELCN